ncbi:putative prolyl 4-hydroxylase 12, partial [Zea mays]
MCHGVLRSSLLFGYRLEYSMYEVEPGRRNRTRA